MPSFILYRWLGWLDTLKPLIVPFWFGGSPLFIFLLRQFFMSIPREFDEAAEIDGANSLRILWQILVPLCMPALDHRRDLFVPAALERVHPAAHLPEQPRALHRIARACATSRPRRAIPASRRTTC